jgi:hypothetical protein
MGPVAIAVRVASALVLGVGGFLLVRMIASPGPIAVADSGPAAWIDAPLDGSELLPAAVQVTGHGADPSGVVRLTLLVNGTPSQSLDTSGGAIETGHFTWQATPGAHRLVLLSLGATGTEVSSATVLINILGRVPDIEDPTTTTQPAGTTTTSLDESTTTTAPPTTTTPSTTPPTTPPTTSPPTTTPPTTTPPTTTPTTVPPTTTCPISAPQLINPPDGYVTSPFFPAPPLNWSYTGCTVNQFVVELARNSSFTDGLQAQSFPSTTFEWNVINGLAQGQWYWRVRGVSGPIAGPWSQTWGFIKG